MIYVPPLRAELMSTTALTPTHHGGIVRTIASIAIAAAIPALAPSIALNIGLSSVIGNIAASALVGGAISVLAQKVINPEGNWMSAFATGAIGGGLGGYYQTPSGMPSYSTGAVDAGGLFPGGVDPIAASPVGPGSAGLLSSPAGQAGQVYGPIETFAGGTGYTGAPTAPVLAPPTGSFVPQAPTYGQGVIPASFVPSRAASGFLESAGGVPDFSSDINIFAPPAAAPPTPTTTGFFEDVGTGLSNFAGDVGKRISAGITPENVAEGLSQLATSAFADTAVDKAPVSPEEDRLRGIRDEARQEQQGYDKLKAEAATKLFAQAGAISPEQRGQEALALEQARYGRAQQAGLRRINPRDTGAVAAYQQQSALRRSRLGGYQRGQESGRKEVIDLYGRGIGLLPTGDAAAAGAATDLAGAKERYDRLLREQKNAGYLARTVFGGLGTRTEEERERLARGQEPLTS